MNVEIFCTLIARDIEAVIQINQIGQKVTQNEALTPLGLMSCPGTALNKVMVLTSLHQYKSIYDRNLNNTNK